MIKDVIRLLRPKQWYKNLVIFLPLIFSGKLFVLRPVEFALLGFVALSLASSGNYVVNDIVDRASDALHPEKKNRPIASGRINRYSGWLIGFILFSLSLSLGFWIDFVVAQREIPAFALTIIALVVSTQFYSFRFKKEPFADILFISINFVLRAIAGAFVIGLGISPWLVLCTFFLALFLAVGKRGSDLALLGADAHKSREVLAHYTQGLVHALMIVATALLVMSYSTYAVLVNKGLLLGTLPFALYVIFRYFALVESGSPIPRHLERMMQDRKLTVGILLWVGSVLGILYL